MAKAENFFGATDMGRQRNNNEDSFIAQQLADGRILACVIDGVGGYEGGEVAAAIARDAVLEEFTKSSGDTLHKMKQAFVRANEKIYEDRFNHPERDRMACVLTLVVADTGNNQLHYAHVGDTRLYLFRDASLVKLTRDHSFVGFLEDNRKISEQEAMNHPKRNEVNKALGFDPHIVRSNDYIDTGSSPFLPGDLLMLCSDGLTDLVDHQTMASLLSGPGALKEKTQRLIDAANQAGGKDNITVVLVHNTNKAIKPKKTRPVVVKKNQAAPAPEENRTMTPPPVFKKRSPGFTIFLLILCLLLGAAAYYFWNQNKKIAAAQLVTPVVQEKTLHAAEKRLQDSLEVSPFLFLDSSYGQRILISDTIVVQKDSLYINGNGIVLQGDTGFKGPLLLAAENCRYISLENMVIENFEIGLIAHSRILRLKNVSFRNCRVALQKNFLFPSGRRLTGVVTDTALFKSDTLSNRSR